ncbi:MAG: Gfo/Idh/MocA family oxidoreductase [Cyanobacteria bacterium P01_D01_bin.105]
MVIRVGLIGTGYAAKARAKSLIGDGRAHLLSVSGEDSHRTEVFAQQYGLVPATSWQALVSDVQIDLVVVATVSSLHGEIVAAALQAGKHVVVEYPLSLDVSQAEGLIKLATQQKVLLHVEHIELLGGLHRAMRSHLSQIGAVQYVNYRTLNPQNPAPRKWTYRKALFGFVYCGALSRVQRMTNLFGVVQRVSCTTRYVGESVDDDWFKGVLSSARLEFASGVVAELTYGKGEGLWVRRREVEVQGSDGAMAFQGNHGQLVTAEGERSIAVEPRKGLFLKDTDAVLSYLIHGAPLYVSASDSLYALKVADALRSASERGETVTVD